MWRKLYYWLPSYLRFVIRWIVYLPADLLKRGNKALSPPLRLIYTGRGNFKKQGQEWLEFFKNYAWLQPHDAVLDIGSGIGRIAIPLAQYGIKKYEGFDAVRQGINWCSKNISGQYPQFHFQYIPLYNDLYNEGGLKAVDFKFPYPDQSFDFICAISVFTHMLPDELENYLLNIKRISRPDTRVIISLFILNEESRKWMNSSGTAFKFPFQEDARHALMDTKVKSANVAYEEPYLKNLFSKCDLEIVHQIDGYWSGRNQVLDLAFQDILVLRNIRPFDNLRSM